MPFTVRSEEAITGSKQRVIQPHLPSKKITFLLGEEWPSMVPRREEGDQLGSCFNDRKEEMVPSTGNQ